MAKYNAPHAFEASRSADRKIPISKKADIIKTLMQLMPATRHRFWHNIAVCEKSADLLTADDLEA